VTNVDTISHNKPQSVLSISSGAVAVQAPIEFKKTKDSYNLNDFEVRAKLGKGAFGSVYLVRLLENTELIFAMKVIDK
jgi:hypothetical protein